MELNERLNVLVQATILSQKSGTLTLDEAVNAKKSIDIISSGTLDQNFTQAMNVLIEIAISSQKRGAYALRDAHMIYLAIEGIESAFKNEIDKLNGKTTVENETQEPNGLKNSTTTQQEVVTNIPPKKLKRNN